MKYFVEIQGRRHTVDLPDTGDTGTAKIDDADISFHRRRSRHGGLDSLLLDGQSHALQTFPDADRINVRIGGADLEATVIDERREAISRLTGLNQSKKGAVGEVKAPMPGLVIKIEVTVGQTVMKGDGLLVIEAMKMENEIRSPIAGNVAKIMVSKGTAVEKGQHLMVVANG